MQALGTEGRPLGVHLGGGHRRQGRRATHLGERTVAVHRRGTVPGDRPRLRCGHRRTPRLGTYGQPGARERGEHRVRGAVGLGHPTRIDGVGAAHPDEAAIVGRQSVRYLGVAAATVRPEVAADVHGIGAHLGGERRNHIDRVAVAVDERTTDRVVERLQRSPHIGQSRRTRRCHEPRIDDEDRHHLAGRSGCRQRRMVVDAQVAPEPEQ